jgi:hypothetical protein
MEKIEFGRKTDYSKNLSIAILDAQIKKKKGINYSNTPFRSGDLRVMSPARFRCAMLLVGGSLLVEQTNHFKIKSLI